jgi:phage baseplate assembly protein W
VAGLAPALPLRTDEVDGHRLIKTYEDLALQNLKMLVLTNPGERMMDPDFGVGLRKYLFEQNDILTYGQIEGKIRNQVLIYLPYIEIYTINFIRPKDIENAFNVVSINIEYSVTMLQTRSSFILELDFDLGDIVV